MQCTQCGAALADLSASSCPFCGTVLAHELRAAERAAAARALLAEDADGDGVPDALAPLLEAQKAKQTRDEERERYRSERSARMLELENARTNLSTLRNSGNLGCGAVTALVVAVIAASVWSIVMGMAIETDPWLGLHARLFCPMVCDGCRAPYSILTWRSGSGRDTSDHLGAYCRNPTIDLDRLDRSGLASRRGELGPYELPGGMGAFIGSTVPVFFLVVLPIVYVRARRGRREGLATLEERVRRLETELARPPPD
ncbi:MAG: hypothetical protein IT379_20250 [Deltaproteobacteria bacterium]|nr:hypothetical protein [Deltaproteobacteria bacterium]